MNRKSSRKRSDEEEIKRLMARLEAKKQQEFVGRLRLIESVHKGDSLTTQMDTDQMPMAMVVRKARPGEMIWGHAKEDLNPGVHDFSFFPLRPE